jgi:hypothetical protein
MHDAAKNIWLILIAVVLMAYANVVLKLRITALGGVSAASWWSYFLSMMLDSVDLVGARCRRRYWGILC